MMTRSIGPAWNQARLDEVAIRGSGHTPNKKHPEYWDGAIPWISLKDTFRLDRRTITGTTDTITAEGLAHSSAVLHPEGTVVLLRDAGIGKSGIMGAAMAVSQHFMAWRCGAKLDNWFLYYYLQRMKPEFERISNGSTIKTIGLEYFKQFTVPLPSIIEQRSISSMLREADDLIAALERLIAKKQAIKQGMMQQLLTGRTRLPGFNGEWADKCLGDVLTVRHGRNQRTVEIPSGTVPILATGGQIGWADRPLYSKPSVLIGRKGTIDRPQYQSQPFWTVDTLFYTEISAAADPRFLYYVFQTIDWRSMNEASGVPSLSSKRIEGVEVRLPDYAEQIEIRKVLDDAGAQIAALGSRLAKAHSIKTGMMQQLLTGRTRLPVETAS